MSARRKLQAAVHAEAAVQGMDADTRRALQRRLTGLASTASMGEADLRAVLSHLRNQRRMALPEGAQARMLRALWISAWHLGVVRDRSDRALAAWCRRQSGLSAARWMTPAHLRAAIEALRDWLARPPEQGGGGVEWRPGWVGEGEKLNPRIAVLLAQDRRQHALIGYGGDPPHHDIDMAARYADMGPAALDAAIRAGGRAIRAMLREVTA